jgi:hypothetical protein
MIHLGAFQVLQIRLDCDMMRQCAHNQDELPCVAAGGSPFTPFRMHGSYAMA